MNFYNQERNILLPWQTKQWKQLWWAKQNNRLPHALLLTGIKGLGKTNFAELFAQALLCAAPSATGASCENCHACHLVRAKSHPDLQIVVPIESQVIKIEQTRQISHFLSQTSMQSGFQVVIINPAYAMNKAAANALLKTLEEPAAHALLILISDQSLRLPATITSRCQKLFFSPPQRGMALAWLYEQPDENGLLTDEVANLLLNLAEGAPLKALALMRKDILLLRQTLYQGLIGLAEEKIDPVSLASAWQDYSISQLLELLLIWLKDFLWFKLSKGQTPLINVDYASFFSLSDLQPGPLLAYLDIVLQRYMATTQLQNINQQLLLEELLINWVQIYKNPQQVKENYVFS